MQNISISLNLLKKKLSEVEKDGMDIIELHIIPSQIEEGTMNPAFLHVQGISKDGTYQDYESIDEFSIAEYLSIHKTA